MAKNTPAFQFYPSDFLGGTALLSDAAVGIYIKMLCQIWIAGGRLPYCTKKLSGACQTTPEEFEAVWPEIEDKFEIEAGSVSHARLLKMIEISKARAESGSKGGSKSKAKRKQTGKQNGSKSVASLLKNEERRMKYEDLEKEDWIVPDRLDTPEVRSELAEFAAMRRRIGKPIKSLKNSSRSLKNFEDPEHLLYAIEVCIANEYQGLKPDYRPQKSTKSVGERSMRERL